ncbi:MAG: MarR family winged helix-turn-helix transcriptional regulator [Actinoallomurus sp.]
MTTTDPSRAPAGGSADESLDAIELQTAILVRNLEMLRRRSDFYREVDRAGYLLLRTLQAMGPADISTLAATLGLDPSTTGRQVAAAHAAGLVERAPTPDDRRRTVITPTPRGIEAMRAVLRRRRDGTAEILDAWNEDDLRTLSFMFTRYNQAIAARYLDPDTGRSQGDSTVTRPA